MAQTSSCLMLITCLMFLSLSQGKLSRQDYEAHHPIHHISCPEGTHSYGSHCYYFYEDRLTWIEADLFCQNTHAGHLVSVLTQSEGNFVASMIKESGTTDSSVWIGLHDPKKTHLWHWSSGSLYTYKAWAPGSPNIANRGYCVSLTAKSGFKLWKDTNCEAHMSFVCKFNS
ncbi:lithostathine-1 isoform X1 [Urocitellus parryii]|uniref:lithostathine-1-alpha isoform X1 n=1 Tax=Urocitellus parryii TaxID=9999 RepID=UPI000E55E81E|nr:lithostathine-1-alpha isoform X1 [Urocitellus parryii]